MASISTIPERMLSVISSRERVAAVLREDRHGHLDAAEGVPDLVRNARRYLAERRQRLLLDHPPLKLLLLREVAQDADGAEDLPLGSTIGVTARCAGRSRADASSP